MRLFDPTKKKYRDGFPREAEKMTEEVLARMGASDCEECVKSGILERFGELAAFGRLAEADHYVKGNIDGIEYEMLFPLFIVEDEKKRPAFEGSALRLKGLDTSCREILAFTGKPFTKPADKGGYTLRRVYSGLGFHAEGNAFLEPLSNREYVVSEAIADWFSRDWSCFKPKAYMVIFGGDVLTAYFYHNFISKNDDYAAGLVRFVNRMPACLHEGGKEQGLHENEKTVKAFVTAK